MSLYKGMDAAILEAECDITARRGADLIQAVN